MDALRSGAAALCLTLVAAAPADPVGDSVTKLMSAAQIPGVQVLVIDKGRVTASRSFGIRDVASKAPVDAHTRFEIGSITKQFTAAAILQLKERGKLKLTDALAAYVPGYAAAKHVTIAQLLGQISGIPNYTDTPAFKALKVTKGGTMTIPQRGDVTRTVALVKNKPLDFAPGTRWEYSNTNYALLGRIVEIASGMPWNAYVRANIFRPAGMDESAFMDDEGTMPDVATGYSTRKGALTRAGTMNGWGAAAGAIVSTAGDVAKWDAALIGGKLLSADDLATMLRPGTLPVFGPKSHYGYGWIVDTYDGQSRVWHNGQTLGFHAARVKRVWDALLSGTLDRSELSDRVNAELTPAVVARSSKELKALGAPTAWTYTGRTATGTMTSYKYRVEFATGTTYTVTMSVGAGGKITDFEIDPDN